MANTAVVYRLKDVKKGFRVAGLFGGVLALGQEGTDEVWAQIADVPIPGNKTGKPMPLGPSPLITTYKNWKTVYPDTLVLAPIEKFQFYYEAYDKKPKGYNSDPMLDATLVKLDSRLKPSVEVLGVSTHGKSKAYPLVWLKSKGRVGDTIGRQKISIIWDKQFDTARVEEPFDGIWMRSYWYAWSTFYPKTTLVLKD